MENIHIRALTDADRAQWQVLWRDYLAFYGAEVTPEVYDTTFARLLGAGNNEFNAFVAEADGNLVGLVHYLFHRHCWRIENVCYLQDLYAAPQARGTGVGRALIEAVYAAADAAQAPSVYWLTQEQNATARRLYDRVAHKTDFIRYQRA